MATYDGETHDECPKACHWIFLDAIPQALLMLAVFRLVGAGHHLRFLQDFRVDHVRLLSVLLMQGVSSGLVDHDVLVVHVGQCSLQSSGLKRPREREERCGGTPMAQTSDLDAD